MTDFIHEQPPEEKKPAPEEKPVTDRERQKRVYTYIMVLFTAAFVLILWSFLSTHRMNQQLTDQLKGSEDRAQTTLEENLDLANEVKALETQVASLEERLKRSKSALDEAQEAAQRQEAVITALDYLRKIEGAFEAYRYETARELVLDFEDNDLTQYLPDQPLHTDAAGNDAESPRTTYERIVMKLFPNGIE